MIVLKAILTLLRWIVCFPCAFLISGASWPLSEFLFHHLTYGPSLISKLVGLTPLVLKTAIPAFIFLVAGVLISPSRTRKVCFVFFACALLFSAGGLEIMRYGESTTADPVLWLGASSGIIVGALAGLWFMLRIQAMRSNTPNQSAHPPLAQGQRG
jgi:Na+-driven multidrug efflux pump